MPVTVRAGVVSLLEVVTDTREGQKQALLYMCKSVVSFSEITSKMMDRRQETEGPPRWWKGRLV